MIDTMGVILAGDGRIDPVTDKRSISALPIAGSYRLIDFVLSNMANAGITNIGVATSSNYTSLMDHIKSGKPWDLDRKSAGLTLLPPNMQKDEGYSYRGNIDVLSGIYDFIKRSKEVYVILSLGTSLYNINFEDVIEKHIETQADISIVYKNMSELSDNELSRFTLIETDDEGRVNDIEVMPYYPKSPLAALDVFVMEKELLCSIIDECKARGEHDLLKDAIIKKLSGLRVFGYEYKGYTDKIDSLQSYYRNNMIFLDHDIREELFNRENPIYTKTKDRAPTKYGKESSTENSFVSDGCVIEGTVINSILSRGVKIAKGAVVKNSIIMQDTVIDEDAYLDTVVFDKEVHITAGRKLIGQDSFPLTIKKGGEV